jgi:hypothetical protein
MTLRGRVEVRVTIIRLSHHVYLYLGWKGGGDFGYPGYSSAYFASVKEMSMSAAKMTDCHTKSPSIQPQSRVLKFLTHKHPQLSTENETQWLETKPKPSWHISTLPRIEAVTCFSYRGLKSRTILKNLSRKSLSFSIKLRQCAQTLVSRTPVLGDFLLFPTL